jgi:uncharacterized membrane protein YfcA
MFCAPLAALWFPQLVPGPLLALGCPLALMALLREWNAIEWRTTGLALVGRVLGTGLAALCLAWLPAQLLSLMFAGLILTGVALSLTGWRVQPIGRNTVLAGTASGLMGTITSAGAPPFAIAMQHMAPPGLRATMGVIFFAGSAVSLVALTAVGRMGHPHFVLALLLLPWMLVGFFASGLLRGRLGQRSVRPLLLGLAAFGALGVLAQNIARY